MNIQIGRLSIWLLVFCCVLGSVAHRPCGAQESPTDLRTALNRLSEAYDIRAEGKAFCLRARLKVRNFKGKEADGSYTLLWSSPERWREEITFADYKRVRVGGDGRVWLSRTVPFELPQIYFLSLSLDLRRLGEVEPDESLEKTDRKEARQALNFCVAVKHKASVKREVCFEPESDDLQWEDGGSTSYEFDGHIYWGKKKYPRTIRVWWAFDADPTHKKREFVEWDLEELIPLNEAHPSDFTPPSGAREWAGCEYPRPLQGISKPSPIYPALAREKGLEGIALVYCVVEPDGTLSHLTLIRSPGSVFEPAIGSALAQWRYSPASCGGKTVPTELVIEVRFWMPKD